MLNFTLNPTLTIYEASRDLIREMNADWQQDYAHPNLWAFFQPSRKAHGSYWFDWTTADEVAWTRKSVPSVTPSRTVLFTMPGNCCQTCVGSCKKYAKPEDRVQRQSVCRISHSRIFLIIRFRQSGLCSAKLTNLPAIGTGLFPILSPITRYV